MQFAAAFLRPKVPTPVDAREIDRCARAIWDNIAGETGSRRETAAKVARLYNVCRDIQRAREQGAMAATLWAIVKLIIAVVRGAR